MIVFVSFWNMHIAGSIEAGHFMNYAPWDSCGAAWGEALMIMYRQVQPATWWRTVLQEGPVYGRGILYGHQ